MSGIRIRPGIWKIRSSDAAADDSHRQDRQQESAEQAADFLHLGHVGGDCLLDLRGRGLRVCLLSALLTSGRPGTICGICWMAPNAAP